MAIGAALQARELRKSYGATVAVESLDLDVAPGRIVGFLGPNGAGKTTVIRILSTMVAPDAGHFSVGGVPDTRPVDIRRQLGVLPESAGYPRGQTGLEWLEYHGRLFNRRRADARGTARRLLAEVGLEDRGASRIGDYSRGMRQRLGIARALVNEPTVVFLDEPTLGLDPGGQVQVLDLVTRIAREHGVTVVLSTHLLAEVEQVCDDVVILNRGRLVAEGTPSHIARRAAAPRTAVVQVPPEDSDRAMSLLSMAGVDVATAVGARAGRLTLTWPGAPTPEELSAQSLGCLLGAAIPVLSFTLEGGRLSDAFLAVTGTSGG